MLNSTIVPPDSRVGEGVCLLRQRLIVWLRIVSGRIATELKIVLKSALRGRTAFALTRCDTVCQIPRKCLLERINTLKYSFILFICFHN